MARKTANIALGADSGRDGGKTFLITEMAANQAEKWAIRALLALTRAGIEVPDDVSALGMGAIAAIGLRAFGNLSFEEAEPLLDEMMGCVQIVTTSGVTRAIDSEDIEEVATYLRLRNEVIALHTGFSVAAELSNYREAAARADQKPPEPLTSPTPSE